MPRRSYICCYNAIGGPSRQHVDDSPYWRVRARRAERILCRRRILAGCRAHVSRAPVGGQGKRRGENCRATPRRSPPRGLRRSTGHHALQLGHWRTGRSDPRKYCPRRPAGFRQHAFPDPCARHCAGHFVRLPQRDTRCFRRTRPQKHQPGARRTRGADDRPALRLVSERLSVGD